MEYDRSSLEDIHTHIEKALIARARATWAASCTPARSRNDQVVTDVKLWVRDAIDELDGLLEGTAAGVRGSRRSGSGAS